MSAPHQPDDCPTWLGVAVTQEHRQVRATDAIGGFAARNGILGHG